jgi:4-hydroxy-tetrahydrodipicolinate reductase
MGRVLAEVAQAYEDVDIIAGIDPAAMAADFGFPVYTSLEDCDLDADVIVDFSLREATTAMLDGAQFQKTPVIIATTGHTDEDKALIKAHADTLPIFQAANMSLGINLMTELIQKAAVILGERFDIEIVEKHHNLKKDAPSGTAYALADAINQVFMNTKAYTFGRHTRTDRRRPEEIGIHAIRSGTIVGEHQVLFAGTDEVFEIRHSAHSKQIFAVGALQAARFMVDKPPGYYTMKDMLVAQSTITHTYVSQDEALISMHGVDHDSHQITEIFKRIGALNINLDMISQTAPTNGKVHIAFTLPEDAVAQTAAVLEEFQATMSQMQFEILSDIAKITVEGPGMEVQSGVAAQVFDSMAGQGIALLAITTSETKIACIVPQADSTRAVNAVKSTFNI